MLKSAPDPAKPDSTPLEPYLTADCSGCGGTLKSVPEDFTVEELPLYSPSGSGEHVYLLVEKRGLNTADVVRHLVRTLHVSPRDIGTAGRKDARAVARQWVSVRLPRDPLPGELDTDALRILEQSRHGNKLRTGHLSGNRFDITVRDIDETAPVAQTLANLDRAGFPNYFGEQRLGTGLHNAIAGRQLLSRTTAPRGNPEHVRFVTNAYQAALFNAVLATRLCALCDPGLMLPGDLAVLHHNGASFPVTEEDLAEAQHRADAREISPSAPLFGYRSTIAQGRPGEWERAVLQREALSLDAFRLATQRLSAKGERRAVRAFAHELRWRLDALNGSTHLHLTFRLDRGIYATSLLREVMKNDALAPLAAQPPDSHLS